MNISQRHRTRYRFYLPVKHKSNGLIGRSLLLYGIDNNDIYCGCLRWVSFNVAHKLLMSFLWGNTTKAGHLPSVRIEIGNFEFAVDAAIFGPECTKWTEAISRRYNQRENVKILLLTLYWNNCLSHLLT